MIENLSNPIELRGLELMSNEDRQPRLRELVQLYIDSRRYPFTNPLLAFYQWFKRSLGDDKSFTFVREHELANTYEVHSKIHHFIKENEILKEDLKNLNVYLKNHISRISYKTIYVLGSVSMLLALVGLFSTGDMVLATEFVFIPGLISIVFISERISWSRHKNYYEELYSLIEREIEQQESKS